MEKVWQEQREIKHPAFNANIRAHLEQIRAAFEEHYSLTLEEWENGFRCDDAPAQQIAVWQYAADIYKSFACNETDADRRADIYRCIFACMTNSRDTVWDTYLPQAIARTEAQRIMDRFYMIAPLG